MYDLIVTQNYSLAGKTYSQQQTISQPDVVGKEDLIPVAWPGVLTVRTNGTDGSLTMTDAGHLIATAAKIDIYWLDATTGLQKSCRAATVGTVAGLIVPFTGALGTALPPAATVIQAATVVSYVVQIVGNNVAALLAAADFAAATIVLLDTGGTVEDLVITTPPSGCYGWLGVGTNPLATKTVDTVHFSHNDTTTPRNVRVAASLTV